MTVQRGEDNQILIQYSDYNALNTYEFRLKGCSEIYPLTIVEVECFGYILFSINVPCTVLTGSYTFELLEDDVPVHEEIIQIND